MFSTLESGGGVKLEHRSSALLRRCANRSSPGTLHSQYLTEPSLPIWFQWFPFPQKPREVVFPKTIPLHCQSTVHSSAGLSKARSSKETNARQKFLIKFSPNYHILIQQPKTLIEWNSSSILACTKQTQQARDKKMKPVTLTSRKASSSLSACKRVCSTKLT